MSISLCGIISSCTNQATHSLPEETTNLTQNEENNNSLLAIDLVSLQEEGSMPNSQPVNIQYDRAFKDSRQYEAYDLLEILAPYFEEMGIDSSSDAIVTFVCTDGYKPTQKVSDIFANRGHIAFKDLTVTPSGGDWPEENKSKYAPFYLVWENIPFDNHQMVWPYGLVTLEIRKHNSIYTSIYPQNDPIAEEGFKYYETYCIKCHSINKVGGDLGPDFNHPMNILEYWDVETIYAFAQNPQSFRYNSRMHPIPLKREEFDKIIAYLAYMKEHKLEE